MSPVVRGIINFSIGVISSTTEEAQKNTMTIKTGQRQSTKKSTPKPRSSSPSPTHSGSQHHYGGPAVSNRPQTSTREANITGALAHASYASIMGNDMDPGEAVQAWVPYQGDSSVSKDHPAIVIGAQNEDVYLLQLASKDRARDTPQEAATERYWFDVGADGWGSKGRLSEVRLGRALWIKATDVHREGSTLPKTTWQLIIGAPEEHYRMHGD